MVKQEWRQYMKDQLARIPDDKFKNLCKLITERLFQDQLWREARTVGLTLAMKREIETRPVIAEGWKSGKRMAVPKCDPHSQQMTFFAIQSFAQLASINYQFEEPIPAKTKQISPEAIDLLIVPGLVFDRNGFRIGYGGGYFDRYLASYPHETLALALEVQVIPKVPREPFDIPVGRLLTEKKTY